MATLMSDPPRPVRPPIGSDAERVRGTGGAPRRILFAAGGTGGHIYPALAVARAIHEVEPATEVRFCCGNRPGELEIYKSAGIEPVVLPISGHGRGALNQMRFGIEMIRAYRAISSWIGGFRPDAAIGFGSYVAVPALLAARRAGAATAIHEQNAQPGLANRFLARRADLILTGVPVAPGLFPEAKTRLVGNPIRDDLLHAPGPKLARERLGLAGVERLCLCFGGSLGAAQVNRLLVEAIRKLPPEAPWHFLWATGPAHIDSVRAGVDAEPGLARRVTLVPYLERMDWAYAAADLVVSRAGAITLAELTALGKPSILIPLPTAGGGHQKHNAEALAAAGAAIVVDEVDPEGVQKISTALVNLAGNCDKLKGMSEAARRLGRPEAAREMAEAIARLGVEKGARG